MCLTKNNNHVFMHKTLWKLNYHRLYITIIKHCNFEKLTQDSIYYNKIVGSEHYF